MAEKFTKDDAKIFVTVNGRDYQGWLTSSVERSLETLASRFSIPVSLIPGNPPDIKRQDAIRVRINDTLVLSGVVLAAEPFYRRDDCGMKIEGRSHSGDLVSCSAIHQGGQWRNARLDTIARDICKPFGIEVKVETDIGEPIQDFKIQHGEKAVAVLARAARLRGVLVTTDAEGRVVITRAGLKKSHGSIVRGANVISMESVGTDADRFSDYFCYGQSNVVHKKSLIELEVGGSIGAVNKAFSRATQQKAQVRDPEMKRYLPLVINADGNNAPADMQRLVDHTMRVRRGMAYGLKYVVEGWTWKGVPWEVNTRVPIYDDIAGLDGTEWLICEAKATVDVREGDVTELVVRPVESYDTVPLKTKLKHGKAKNKRGKDGAVLEVTGAN
ncbi:phage baseplate assembly protein [Burkholderia cepacia]|uniref:phage baseplate assembly protein n=1 Tax=Burkholderia cepacia TaxID=292 RepID=UPI003EE35F8B